MFKFYKGKVGSKAYEVSKVWRLGVHIFLNEEDIIFRICYLRNKKGTHYIQLSIKVRKQFECNC